jgi:SAM-dependent methyltransferase
MPWPMTQAAAPPRFAPAPQDEADRALSDVLRDLLAHDARTEGLRLDVAVHGRVAHVTGEVVDEEQRALVRRLLRRAAGLQAVWDLLALPGEPLQVLDVGCGACKQVLGAVGVDCEPAPGVDVVADLQRGLPFPDASADHVFAVHVLEHLDDLVAGMRELHRVLRPTGVLHVLTPDRRSVNAVADPTHRRLMDVKTFQYFCTPRPRIPRWRPLGASEWRGTVHADLQPVAAGAEPPTERELARWFG